MSMVHILAVITTKPGQRDAVLDLFRANVPAVKEEDGCIEYGAAVDADEHDVIVPNQAGHPLAHVLVPHGTHEETSECLVAHIREREF